MTNQPITVTLRECPFCGVNLRHVESWACSFTPPRLYHEYHHDNKNCHIGKRSWGFDEKPESRQAFADRWNARTTHTPSQPTSPDDYEPYRPALQADYAIRYNDPCVDTPMDEDDIVNIRAGLAFAAAMPSQHSELADIADELEDLLADDLCGDQDVGFAVTTYQKQILPALRQSPDNARIDAMEALQFYADNASYCRIFAPGLPETDLRTFAPVLQDNGKRAREALKGQS